MLTKHGKGSAVVVVPGWGERLRKFPCIIPCPLCGLATKPTLAYKEINGRSCGADRNAKGDNKLSAKYPKLHISIASFKSCCCCFGCPVQVCV